MGHDGNAKKFTIMNDANIIVQSRDEDLLKFYQMLHRTSFNSEGNEMHFYDYYPPHLN